MALPLPDETRALYAELVDRLGAERARRSIGRAPGTFTAKRINDEEYVYFQFSEPGGLTRQLYLGKKSPALERLIERFKAERPDVEKERADLERLCSQIAVGGGWSMGTGAARVLKAFSDSGVFEAGAVLVGTHAFGALGNMLGVHWSGANLRTNDVDLAAVSLVASPDRPTADAPKALDRLQMGFLPVPSLDPKAPSTSFKVRGRALRVDFLTPGRGGRAVPLPGLRTAAQPLPFLEYLLESPERAACLDAGGFSLLVPSPARFALHKVLVSQERPASEQAKAAKDLAQAAELIAELDATRPGDLRLAARRMRQLGWSARLERGLQQLSKLHPAAAGGVGKL
jgi:hypothetical protein